MRAQIKVFAEYQEYKLTSISRVEKLISKIAFDNNTEIELDLRGCLIDYYATSKLVDKVLEILRGVVGGKKLCIITDLHMGEAPLLNALLLGSSIFSLTEDHELDIETLRSKITPKLLESNICLEVSIINIAGVHHNTIRFGACNS